MLWPALPAGREGTWDAAETLRVCQPGSSPAPRGALPRPRRVMEQQSTRSSPGAKELARLLAQHEGSHCPGRGRGEAWWGQEVGKRGRTAALQGMMHGKGRGNPVTGGKHHHGQDEAPGSRGPSLHPTPGQGMSTEAGRAGDSGQPWEVTWWGGPAAEQDRAKQSRTGVHAAHTVMLSHPSQQGQLMQSQCHVL